MNLNTLKKTMNPFRISDGANLIVDLLDYGARIVQINYKGFDLACTYTELTDYGTDPFYLGATIGPICNRIRDGQLSIDGKRFQMPRNEGDNTLHSGNNGFDKQTWQVVSQSDDSVAFQLDYDLKKSGMQGKLTTIARYTVDSGVLRIEYESTCDETTFINVTNHVYLNLSGSQSAISDHKFTMLANTMVQIDQHKLPTGKTLPLNPPWEYSVSQPTEVQELRGASDHHFNVGNADDKGMKSMLKAHSKTSGISLEVRGNAPGFQFYTGSYLSKPFQPSSGFCVETQLAPDAINQAAFCSPLLSANEKHLRITEFEFY